MVDARSNRGMMLGLLLAVAPVAAGHAGEPETNDAAPRAPHRRPTSHSPAAAEPKDGRQTGVASFYSHHLSGRRTASGERYDPNALTAAHRTLPMGTRVRVVNPKNDRSVVVTVNDRGPVPKNRVMDVSSAAADALGMKKSGVTKVETQVVGRGDAAMPSSAPADDAAKR